MTYSDLPTRVETPKSLFNPLRTDFIHSLRDDENVKHEYIIRSMEIETFPTYIADVLIEHLIDDIYNEQGGVRDDIRKDIEA